MNIDIVNPNINSNKPSFSGKRDGRWVVKTLSNPDSLMATVVLEAAVTGGRGANAYKRGGVDEFRERFIDDVVSAVFWMKGVDIFNSMGDKFGKNVLKLPTTEFDVGKDALRNPFENLSQDIINKKGDKEAKSLIKKLSIFKFSKIISSTLLSTAVIGYIMPKINQKITEKVMQQKKMDKLVEKPFEIEIIPYKSKLKKNITIQDFIKHIDNKEKNPSFKGLNDITQVSHMLENNTICKMLTNDAGIISGRAISARNPDEGIEYVFRDSSSLFFYFASTPLMYGFLQKISGLTEITNLDPVAAKMLHKNLSEELKKTKTGFINAEEFQNRTLGVLDENSKKLLEKLPFKSDVISLKELKNHVKDKDIIKRAEEMAQLQPEIAKIGKVLTKQQVADVFRNGSITKYDFMNKMYEERFGNKIFDKYRYISMDKITKFRENIDKYVKSVIDIAHKKNGGIVDEKLLEKISKKSYRMSAIFRTFALAVSALALGELIPWLQYAITERRTGSKSAPGFREFE